MLEYLFSYGTLQPGLAPADIELLMRDLPRRGRAYIYGLLYDLGEYPGVRLVESDSKVWGQVFELPTDPSLLRRLDEYEEFDPSNIDESQFLREKCMATLQDGNILEVWVYVYNRDVETAAVIESGDFGRIRATKLSKSQ
jgi:gamma-glutamylcyclotransferase (GGCT)/AIG2-like uncharacterized protein YtfP